MEYYDDLPPVLLDYLSYHENIKSHSAKTVQEYFLDLRMFFRFLKMQRDHSLRNAHFDEISIADVNIDLLRSVTVSDILGYMNFLSHGRSGIKGANSRGNAHQGLNAKSKARKQASIRSFFNYLTKTMHLLENNPALALDTPKQKKSLPQYLTEAECNRLLDAVSGPFPERDYCMILIFLSCGLRISELVGINLSDLRGEALRIQGKGNKERILFLTEAVLEAIDDYLLVRDDPRIPDAEKDALFISRNFRRISSRGVQQMVEKTLLKAGLDAGKYSPHKLRHSAATLMLQNGVDVRTLQEVLGHEHLNTTQIYTHVDNEGLRVAAAANPMGRRRKEKTKEE